MRGRAQLLTGFPLFAAAIPSATAQDRVELFGGYSFGHTHRTSRLNDFVRRGTRVGNAFARSGPSD